MIEPILRTARSRRCRIVARAKPAIPNRLKLLVATPILIEWSAVLTLCTWTMSTSCHRLVPYFAVSSELLFKLWPFLLYVQFQYKPGCNITISWGRVVGVRIEKMMTLVDTTATQSRMSDLCQVAHHEPLLDGGTIASTGAVPSDSLRLTSSLKKALRP
jgi:hypothetical protein